MGTQELLIDFILAEQIYSQYNNAKWDKEDKDIEIQYVNQNALQLCGGANCHPYQIV